ncbi:MAG: beta-ketoacyl synthase N-terminal-like domain-containing protein, partial [Pseudomonadota bacterium]
MVQAESAQTPSQRALAEGCPAHDPIAILGMACRLPDCGSPDDFWRMLIEGRSAIRSMGGARWDPALYCHPDRRKAGRSYTDVAALVDGIYDFDAGFFGLSAREAEQMDPQQRLLLMAVWEAMEDAGLTIERRAGYRIGTYVGCSASDHGHRFLADPSRIDASFMTGNTLSIVANRLSHAFDLNGPSFTVDTACSSSLVALDHAVKALSAGEIDWAVVGGVHALLSPLPFIGFSRAGMLSPSGRLRAFDADADGYVRGEGAIAMVLGRADLAAAAGDHAHALIRATGVNSTGRTGGLTKPASHRQEVLMRETLDQAGTSPSSVAFVEAHGTGTPVGDPQEAEAIGRALAQDRDDPLPIGSVKPNIGHLEPASGLAGVLKATLALTNGCLPPSLGCDTPSSSIDWLGLHLKVATEPTVLPAGPDRCAVVNSFGFGGANACAVLQCSPRADLNATPKAEALVVSAASRSALERHLQDWRRSITEAPQSAHAIMSAAAHKRSRLAHTAVLLSDEVCSDVSGPAITGKHPGGRTEVVFAFCGNGATYAEMGQVLLAEDEAYATAYDRVGQLFAAADPALDPRLPSTPHETGHASATRAQPTLFALQVALVETLSARGLVPGAVIGHSIGEVAAAWAAGALALEDAVRLIATRAPLVGRLSGAGGMLALLAEADIAEELIGSSGLGDLVVSGDNSPRSVTISGSDDALTELQRIAKSARLASRRLPVDYPFHSPKLAPLEHPFMDALGHIDAQRPRIPMASSTLGSFVGKAPLDIAFWWRNLRDPVRFRSALEELGQAQFSLFLEIGPKPVLKNYIQDTLSAQGRPVATISSLDQRRPDMRPREMVAQAVALGATVDMERFVGPRCTARMPLPRYPWDLTRSETQTAESETSAGAHRLLGRAFADSNGWEAIVDTTLLPWLADHRVERDVVMPAAGFASLMLDAAQTLQPTASHELAGLDVIAPLPLSATEGRTLRTRFESNSGHILTESRTDQGEGPWLLHARARVRPSTGSLTAPLSSDLDDAQTVQSSALYDALEADGLDYGPFFRRVDNVAHAANKGRANLRPLDGPEREVEEITALDAALQALHPLIRAALPTVELDGDLLLPTRFERIRRIGRTRPSARADLTLTSASEGSVLANVTLLDRYGEPTMQLCGVRLARIARSVKARAQILIEEELGLEPSSVLEVNCPPATGSAQEPTEPSDADLLIDALALDAVRRVSKDYAAAIGAASLNTDAPCHGLARVMLALAGPEDTAQIPERAALIDAAMAVAPEEGARLRQVLALEGGLRHCLESGAAKTLPGCVQTSPQMRRDAAELRHAALLLCKSWPRSSRLSVLASGRVAQDAVQYLRERVPLAAVYTGDLGSEPPEDAAIDLALVSETERVDFLDLKQWLSPTGYVLASARPPSTMEQLSAALEHPSGGLQQPLELRLSKAGFRLNTKAPGHGKAATVRFAQKIQSALSAPTSSDLPHLAEGGEEADTLWPKLAAALQGHRAAVIPTELLPELASGNCLVLVDGCQEISETLTAAIASVRDALTSRPDRLWVLVLGDQTGPIFSGVSGLLRSVANEHPNVEPRVLSLPVLPWCADVESRLLMTLSDPPADRELRLGNADVTASRLLVRAQDQQAQSTGSPEPSVRLHLGRRGDPSSLTWRPDTRRTPVAGEIEVSVSATGLNFRDVMWVNGSLPEDAVEGGFVGRALGMEIAGTVLRTGSDSRFAPGDRVVGITKGGFTSHAILDDATTLRVPEQMAIECAAGLPVAHLTARYALNHLAQIAPGETVLIHGAAGGVGLAAMAVARAAGARILATAGSDDKRALVRELGAEAVFDSRSLAFADAARAHTEDRGVDVVLNSLAGEAMLRSLDCLAPFGRFIELGKRDLLEDNLVGLRALRSNISYHAVDVDQLLSGRPKTARALLDKMEQDLANGRLSTLPVQIFEHPEVTEAMRAMREAAHIGKVVVRPPPVGPASETLQLGQGSWLVVGGLGGFGVETARWLANQGVRQIWLTSRSGTPKQGSESILTALRADGTDVRVVRADATDAAAMSTLF